MTHPKYVIDNGAAKCRKCTQTTQGCYWEGVSRRGMWKVKRKGGKVVEVAKEASRPKPGMLLI